MCFWRKKYKTVEEIVEGCERDPHRISAWILRNIRYVTDKENHDIKEYAQTPEETLTGKYRNGKKGWKRSGDCEDFAILLQACLKVIGVQSFILGVWEAGKWEEGVYVTYKPTGHAVLVYKIRNEWYLFSNWGKSKCKCETLPEIPKLIYKKGKWCDLTFDGTKLHKGKAHAF